jgi:hypothetical protein
MFQTLIINEKTILNESGVVEQFIFLRMVDIVKDLNFFIKYVELLIFLKFKTKIWENLKVQNSINFIK